jgi:hypothetical protein
MFSKDGNSSSPYRHRGLKLGKMQVSGSHRSRPENFGNQCEFTGKDEKNQANKSLKAFNTKPSKDAKVSRSHIAKEHKNCRFYSMENQDPLELLAMDTKGQLSDTDKAESYDNISLSWAVHFTIVMSDEGESYNHSLSDNNHDLSDNVDVAERTESSINVCSVMEDGTKPCLVTEDDRLISNDPTNVPTSSDDATTGDASAVAHCNHTEASTYQNDLSRLITKWASFIVPTSDPTGSPNEHSSIQPTRQPTSAPTELDYVLSEWDGDCFKLRVLILDADAMHEELVLVHELEEPPSQPSVKLPSDSYCTETTYDEYGDAPIDISNSELGDTSSEYDYIGELQDLIEEYERFVDYSSQGRTEVAITGPASLPLPEFDELDELINRYYKTGPAPASTALECTAPDVNNTGSEHDGEDASAESAYYDRPDAQCLTAEAFDQDNSSLMVPTTQMQVQSTNVTCTNEQCATPSIGPPSNAPTEPTYESTVTPAYTPTDDNLSRATDDGAAYPVSCYKPPCLNLCQLGAIDPTNVPSMEPVEPSISVTAYVYTCESIGVPPTGPLTHAPTYTGASAVVSVPTIGGPTSPPYQEHSTGPPTVHPTMQCHIPTEESIESPMICGIYTAPGTDPPQARPAAARVVAINIHAGHPSLQGWHPSWLPYHEQSNVSWSLVPSSCICDGTYDTPLHCQRIQEDGLQLSFDDDNPLPPTNMYTECNEVCSQRDYHSMPRHSITAYTSQ